MPTTSLHSQASGDDYLTWPSIIQRFLDGRFCNPLRDIFCYIGESTKAEDSWPLLVSILMHPIQDEDPSRRFFVIIAKRRRKSKCYEQLHADLHARAWVEAGYQY